MAKMNKKWNPAVSIFKCCKSPVVIDEVTIGAILNQIKTGGQNLDLIKEARKRGKESTFYEKVKTTKINTFTPNATFRCKRNLGNIKELSKLVYLDIDGCTDIDVNNPYIYATWLSLSATGRGVLVRAKGLNKDNFAFAYESIAMEIGLDVDPMAKDISRQVVISYDPEMYINPDSKSYNCTGMVSEKRDIPLTVPLKKKKERNVSERGVTFKNIRYNDFEDYDLEGKEYEVFDEPVGFSKFHIPEVITKNRYSTISATVHQYMALNPDLPLESARHFIEVLNKRCSNPLDDTETDKIKRDIEKKMDTGDLFPILNVQRYTAFSENVSTKDRQIIGAKVAGRNKRRKTLQKIQDCLNSWDLNLGKATNKKIAEITGLAQKTVDKYSKFFKDQKEIINNNVITI